MKIILATGLYPPDIGGPATYTERLASELSQRGFDIGVITYADAENLKLKTQNAKPQFKIKKISRGLPGALRHFLYFWKLVWLSRDANIIYAQNVTSAGLPAVLAAKLLRKKLILKVVGDAAWEQNKKYLRPIQEYAVKNAHKVITPSWYVKKMVESWEAPEHKIEVIYNAPEAIPPLDISKEEAKRKIAIGGDIILSIGRLVSWKGFSTLIAIMPDLLKENPNFQLVIIGEGEEISNLKSQISNLKLENSVKLTGKIDHSMTPLYYKAAEVCVLNSAYEGLSHVILEAMQQDLPVIASNQGGNPELIEDDFNGFLAEYNNKERIQEAILKIWRDKELQEKFIRNSRAKLKQFTWENLVEKTLKVLRT